MFCELSAPGASEMWVLAPVGPEGHRGEAVKHCVLTRLALWTFAEQEGFSDKLSPEDGEHPPLTIAIFASPSAVEGRRRITIDEPPFGGSSIPARLSSRMPH